MGDNSGSRYGIVSALTQQKIALIAKADALEMTAELETQKADAARKNFKNDKENIMGCAEDEAIEFKKQASEVIAQAKKACIRLEREVAQKEAMAKLQKENVKKERTSLDKQIAAIDDALTKLEKISKDSVPAGELK
jgi:glucose-6-phosphate isomerase